MAWRQVEPSRGPSGFYVGTLVRCFEGSRGGRMAWGGEWVPATGPHLLPPSLSVRAAGPHRHRKCGPEARTFQHLHLGAYGGEAQWRSPG